MNYEVYGAVHKSLMSGIPIVIPSVGQDKAAVGAITDSISLLLRSTSRSNSPVPRRNKIVENPSYGVKAKELSKASDRYGMQKVLDDVAQYAVKD